MSSKIFGFCVAFIVYLEFLATPISGDPENNTFALGSVDGKTYYIDATHRNWSKSRAHCEKLGMQIATIRSESQAEFLKLVYDPTFFNGWFWLGARDMDHDGKFEWSNNNEEVETFKNIRWMEAGNEDSRKHCLTFSSNNHASSYYFKRSCHHEYYTICEDEHPNRDNALIPHISELQREFQEFSYLGTFNGKAYFGDAALRTWSESRLFCERKGLKIATVSISARTSFFKSACQKINYDGWFWVAGEGVKNGAQNSLCSCYSPHDNLYFQRVCYSKHFTICEGLASKVSIINTSTESMNQSISVVATENRLDLGTTEFSQRNESVYRISPEIQKESYSKTVFIVGIFILVLIIIGLLIRQTKIWNRNLNPSQYLPVVEYFKYEDVAKDFQFDNHKFCMNEKQ